MNCPDLWPVFMHLAGLCTVRMLTLPRLLRPARCLAGLVAGPPAHVWGYSCWHSPVWCGARYYYDTRPRSCPPVDTRCP